MAADFTRFDFHAKKFYFSENVQIMSAEEVGQYLLLLVYSWLGGKDASLPDNPVLLARMARVSSVSELVLSMFPIVETAHGPRRQNDTLYEEWSAAVKRSTQAAKKANDRWGNATEEQSEVQQQCNSNAAAYPTAMPSPSRFQADSKSIQTSPVRTNPSQSSPLQPRKVLTTCDTGLVAPDPTENQEQVQELNQPDFKSFRRQFRNKKLDLGNDKVSIARYMEACAKYGVGSVHAALDSWATERTVEWMKSNNVRSHIGKFISQLEKTIERMADDKTVDVAMIDADVTAEKAPAVLVTNEAVAAADDVILQLVAEEERNRAERIAKFSSEPEVAVDPEKFLED